MNYNIKELLAVNLSKTFHDGEVGFTGLATGKAASDYITSIPLAAMELARQTHAPNLTILLCGWLVNPDLSKLTALPESEFSNEFLNMSCEAHMRGWPGIWNHRSGDISFSFGSGAQVDRDGNLNSTCVGDFRRPKVQLVGPIFLPEHFTLFGREYIMMPHHDIRNFVKKVDFISGVGYPGGIKGRKSLGLLSGGPKYIYTPKCIFSFDDEGKIFVKSIHPGISKEDLIENTGFDIGDLRFTPTTEEPTEEELKVLRKKVDPSNILLS